MDRAIPLLAKEGGCASKKSREATEAAQTGWSLTSRVAECVVATWFVSDTISMAAPYRACAGSARRPLQQLLRLRAIALTAHIPLIVGKSARSQTAPQSIFRVCVVGEAVKPAFAGFG
jgi:hypothetical protein